MWLLHREKKNAPPVTTSGLVPDFRVLQFDVAVAVTYFCSFILPMYLQEITLSWEHQNFSLDPLVLQKEPSAPWVLCAPRWSAAWRYAPACAPTVSWCEPARATTQTSLSVHSIKKRSTIEPRLSVLAQLLQGKHNLFHLGERIIVYYWNYWNVRQEVRPDKNLPLSSPSRNAALLSDAFGQRPALTVQRIGVFSGDLGVQLRLDVCRYSLRQILKCQYIYYTSIFTT